MIKVKLRPEQGIKVKTTPAQSPDVKLKTVYLYDADWIPEINKAVEEANESAESAKTSAESAEASANSAAESAYQSQQSALAASEYASNAEADASNVRETLDLVLDAETAATNAAQTATEKAQQATDGANIATQKAGVSTEQANIATEKADEASQFALECQEIKNSLGSVYKFKGSVNTFDDLPTVGNEVGDVYNIIDTDKNYAWDGEKWDDIGGTVDLSDYALKTEIPDIQINGTSIVQEGVANIPRATTSVLGVVKVSPNQGISAFSQGDLCIISANQNEISAKTQSYKPIVPKNLDYAVKLSITTNTIDLTDEEQNSVKSWIGVNPAYKSISEVQKTVLLNEGTYDGNEVSDGEVFTEYDGKFVEFAKESLASQGARQVTMPINGTTFGHGFRVVVWGRKNETSYYSDDKGKTWNAITVPFEGARMFAHNGSLWMAASHYYTATSEDGKVWVQQSNFPSSNASYLGSFGGKFYTYFTSSYWYSEDGSSWTQGTSPVSGSIVLLCRDADILLFAENGDIYRSTDGVSWTNTGNNVGFSMGSYAKAYYVLGKTWAYSSSTNTAYSEDLSIWTKSSTDAIGSYVSVENVNNGFAISVNQDSTSKSLYYYTENGIDWFSSNTPASYANAWVSKTDDGSFYIVQWTSTTGFIGSAGTAFVLKDLSYSKSEVEALISEETSPLATKEYVDTTEQEIIQNFMDADTALQTQINGQATAIAGKQDKLTAGENITIENNVISASGASGNFVDLTSDQDISGNKNFVGSLSFNGAAVLTNFYYNATDDSLVKINGGSQTSTGASLHLYGTSSAYQGIFHLISRDDGGSESHFIGYPAGKLTWKGKSHTSWSMPGTRTVNLTTTNAALTTFTAPADGWYCIKMKTTTRDYNLYIVNTTTDVGMNAGALGGESYACCPAKNGDTVKIYRNGTVSYCRFVYAYGTP